MRQLYIHFYLYLQFITCCIFLHSHIKDRKQIIVSALVSLSPPKRLTLLWLCPSVILLTHFVSATPMRVGMFTKYAQVVISVARQCAKDSTFIPSSLVKFTVKVIVNQPNNYVIGGRGVKTANVQNPVHTNVDG